MMGNDGGLPSPGHPAAAPLTARLALFAEKGASAKFGAGAGVAQDLDSAGFVRPAYPEQHLA